MFDVCTTGDTAHIDTIFKFLPHTHTSSCWRACGKNCIIGISHTVRQCLPNSLYTTYITTMGHF